MSAANNPWERIEHVVVLMLENRSFDNLLGWLYDPSNQPPFNQPPPANFEGVSGKPLSNPGPSGPVPVGRGTVMTDPQPDPGEPYQDIYCQLYNVTPVPPLGGVPPDPPQPPGMLGFVNNYAQQKGVTNPSIIMNCFTPLSVPVLSSLAYYYGVCDHWFAPIPTQTLCNRSFVHAGTSSGYVNNQGDNGIIFINQTPTIFNLLEEAGQSWKIYHASWLITCLALLTQDRLWELKFTDHFAHLKQFKRDAGQPGGLPAYSFIEPVYIDSLIWGAEDDMHPEADPFEFFGPSNVERGERLLYEVYTTLRNSPDWEKTLLVILFDEHGGCYDHVPPPAATPPDAAVIPPDQPGGSGFRFDRLGVRVPAVVVSAYTEQQTIINEVFDHTAVLSSVINCFGLTGELGKRQAGMPDVSAALNLTQARTDRPPIPQPPSAMLELPHLIVAPFKAKPLSGLQKTIIAGASYRLAHLGPHPLALEAATLSQAQTTLQADLALARQEFELLRMK
jgi:phospholipase C